MTREQALNAAMVAAGLVPFPPSPPVSADQARWNKARDEYTERAEAAEARREYLAEHYGTAWRQG